MKLKQFYRIPDKYWYRIHFVRPRFKNNIENVLLYMATECCKIPKLPSEEYNKKYTHAIRMFPGNIDMAEKTIQNWRTGIPALFSFYTLGDFTYLDNYYSKNPFRVIYAIDNDIYCTKIYNDNFENKCIVGDIRQIRINTLPDFDILIGWFPCQSFSISAQNPPRLGYKDDRGMLFFEMVKILNEKKPRFFIAENVKGLLSANKGKAFPMILQEFDAVGYFVKYQLLNAYDYGVPQKRERIIIVGFREKEDYMHFQFPQPIQKEKRKVLQDALLTDENNNEKIFFSQKAIDGMMAVRAKMNKGRVMNPQEPCNTISAHLSKVSMNSTDPVLKINDRYRRFSTREAANIQSFPNSFKFSSVSEIRQYKAIGNAVPPILMWHIANKLSEIIDSNTIDSHYIKNNHTIIDFPIQQEICFA